MEPKINQQLTDRYAPYQEVCFVIDQQLLPPPFAKNKLPVYRSINKAWKFDLFRGLKDQGIFPSASINKSDISGVIAINKLIQLF